MFKNKTTNKVDKVKHNKVPRDSIEIIIKLNNINIRKVINLKYRFFMSKYNARINKPNIAKDLDKPVILGFTCFKIFPSNSSKVK